MPFQILDYIITNRLTPTKWRKNFQDLLVAINIAGLGKAVEGLMRGKVESCVRRRIKEMVAGGLVKEKKRDGEVFYVWRDDVDNFLGQHAWMKDFSPATGKKYKAEQKGILTPKPSPKTSKKGSEESPKTLRKDPRSDNPRNAKKPATRRGGHKSGDYRPIRATSITQVGGNVGENNTNRSGNNRGATATSKTVFVIGGGYGHIGRHMADTDDESELGGTGLHEEEAGESSDDDSGYDDFSDFDDDGDGDDTEDHDNGSGEEDQDPDVEMPDAPTLTLNPSHLHLHWDRHKHQHCHCSHDALGSRSCTRHQGSPTSSSNGGSNSTTRSMLSKEAITPPTPRTPATPSPTPTIAARVNRALSICSMTPSESASSAPAPRARPEGERLAAAHSKCSGLSTEELLTSIDQAAGAVIGLATWRMAVMAAETDPGLANDLRERIESLLEMVDVMKEVLREKMGGEKEDYCFGGRFWWWMKVNWAEENIGL
ncbi:hypothetical protein CDV36_014934 [Fusarium kuroshium]|uniref:Uncharacterized protein n=1 Tax=Fusarium kuroshium TaxID=2010991 RepID=A0A3M2RE70_9HYPO|nr:hypothetical protein CDV36_014934 [Fusarium kuroshium]